ncbi:MAG: bifunctional hydroxymethylpyrimidine kinase/phosphomethylpyrimidine kinase [Chlorobi bacterium]|nr:bifunctional hydroxymethylpyrimidine kinase/phosphomethylpyrimidine kinase [Chlorobiota bacterium]
MERCHIAIVGDVMLDRYYRGTASRLSPEAPVPVVEIVEESEHLGGGANVAYNLSSLGVQASIFGVVGDDRSGEHLRLLLEGLGIESSGLIVQRGRTTTVKTRVIADGQHIVRADQETKERIGSQVQKNLLASLNEKIEQLDGLILQDYNKGVFSPEVIEQILSLALAHNIPTFVDPKFENFFAFKASTLFKPNRKETEDALQCRLTTLDDKLKAAHELKSRLRSRYVVLTLGSDGMILVGSDDDPVLVPTRSIQVADISGAGDTVIAILAAASSVGATMREAVELANHAAGIVCEQVGTVPVTRQMLVTMGSNVHA